MVVFGEPCGAAWGADRSAPGPPFTQAGYPGLGGFWSTLQGPDELGDVS